MTIVLGSKCVLDKYATPPSKGGTRSGDGTQSGGTADNVRRIVLKLGI